MKAALITTPVSLALLLATVAGAAAAPPAPAVPPGFSIELVAAPPLVERPVVAAFDDAGRLYVAESSGSNDPVEVQLQQRPHRVVRLEDVDGDGRFDRRVVFADSMMFLAGAMFHDGSLYVAAPPSIWKLSDTDGDGVADERSEWFHGKTLTGCANDLHGPYAGLDGRFYWCKGAFAAQTHQVRGRPFHTRASHIFRARPDGSDFEPVMTGGMDNPVDVAFTPAGEPLLTATIIQQNGRRDGILHAVYGGVFGKEHDVLDGHPRTGELMPAMVLLDPVAPSGLERYESEAFGPEYRDNFFACQFNTRKVSRHELQAAGATFASRNSDFVVFDAVDFHPTDVLADADGSLLVVDTGGWYKLCCPTSQLWKPDVLGGIWRVRRTGASPTPDPRGAAIDWARQSLDELWSRLADARPAVRRRAADAFAARRDDPAMRPFLAALAAAPLDAVLTNPPASADATATDAGVAALARAWALVRVDAPEAHAILRRLLQHADPIVRQVALHAASLHRDPAALPQSLACLGHESPAVRRAAAEALGRIGDSTAAPHLLAAAATAEDRFLQHSITFALIELADPAATRGGLASEHPAVVATALVALDGMPGGGLQPSDVIPRLNAADDRLRRDAQGLVARHGEWGGELAQWLAAQLAALPPSVENQPAEQSVAAAATPLESLLASFAADARVQQVLADPLIAAEHNDAARRLVLRVMAAAKLPSAPAAWTAALAQAIAANDEATLELAVAAACKLPPAEPPSAELHAALAAVAADPRQPADLRIAALSRIAPSLSALDQSQWSLLVAALAVDSPASVAARTAAADALAAAPLVPAQLEQLGAVIESAAPLEINRLLPALGRPAVDEPRALALLAALRNSAALPAVRVDRLRAALVEQGPPVHRRLDELESIVNVDAAAQRRRIEELLPRMAGGDVHRGHAVFNSSQAACSACHRMGYGGGTVGPELSHIGAIRTERDLLESILYPSLSFVQSYEPTLILTTEGRAVAGRIVDESADALLVATGPNEEVRVARADVAEQHPGEVSVMPAGLDRQLTESQLADLVAFLKNAR